MLLSTARRFHLLPEAYIYGLGLTVQFASERAAFLNGRFATTGWWWYFPYAFVGEDDDPGMIVGLLALAGARRAMEAWRPGSALAGARDRRASMPARRCSRSCVVYWDFALTTHLNIGHRHLLPIYPALCILAGGAAFWIQPLFERTPEGGAADRTRPAAAARAGPRRRRRRRRASNGAGVATVVLLAWHVGESVDIRPNYLAYFNQLAGGPSQGYKHLADSSLDWGQDLPALKQWLDGEGLQQPGDESRLPVVLRHRSSRVLRHPGDTCSPGFIDRRPPQAPAPLGAGVYCISATVLDVIEPHVLHSPSRRATTRRP